MKSFLKCSMLLLYTAVSILLISQAEIHAQKNAQEPKAIAITDEENGPSLTNQIIVFPDYHSRSNDIIRAMHAPELRVVFSLGNQQYGLPAEQISSGKGVSFGAAPNSIDSGAIGYELFPKMNAVSFPSNMHFTFSSDAPGKGIDVNVKKAIQVFTSAKPLYNAGSATNGRYYYGDLTINFNQPVADPILHIVGLGGFYSSLGFTTELEMQETGIALSKLSGSDELVISETTKILNAAPNPDAYTGAGAASGSILVSGSGITSLTFKLYLRGDGAIKEWGNSAVHAGDIWLIGVSLNTPVKSSANMLANANSNTNE